jgi:hypothetical protein
MRTCRVIAAISLAGLAATLASCGSRAAEVPMPVRPRHVLVSGAKAVVPTERAEVVVPYEGYWLTTP